MIFRDRYAAGRALAQALRNEPDLTDGIVLGLPRGGVPVAWEIAHELHLPLDVFVVRKLGVPGEEELAMGAIASGGIVVTEPQVIRAYAIGPEMIEAAVAREEQEIERREKLYRAGSPGIRLDGRTAILVDDGIATGSSMKAAILALRTRARAIVVAVPVAARSSYLEIQPQVQRMICLARPERFYAVGEFYRHFDQTSDDEVRALLAESRQKFPVAAAGQC